MIVYIKANDVELASGLSPIEWVSVVDIANRGDIHVSIMVSMPTMDGKVRAGFIPLEDIDVERTTKALNDLPNQLPLVLL